MSLMQRIKADQLAARKNKDTEGIAISLLTTLIGEASIIGKNAGNRESSDAEVITVIQKFIKNLQLTLQQVSESEAGKNVRAICEIELEILKKYLPKQLTVEDIYREIATVKEQVTDVKKLKGAVMKHFKEKFNGQYDSEIVLGIVDGK